MVFSLDVRRARKGDCMLLHYGPPDTPGLVMIDGGPRGVYGPHLKPRLKEIREARGIADNDPLPVDVLMVSHVDDDHIQGILDLTKELLEAKRAQRPQSVQVLSLWHNSFDEIIDGETEELTASVSAQFGPASVSGGGELSDDERAEVEEESDEDAEVVSSSLKVLASIKQGFQLRVDAEGLGFERNLEFGGHLIVADKGQSAVDMGRALTFTVAGPLKPELEALRKKHNEWLKELEKEGKSPPQALAAYVDKSVPNLSSLVLLAESEGKSMLLTGDARGDKILEGLALVGLLKKGKTLNVDLLKVPHHGSANNLEQAFFERIIAKHYVFSGDGEHGNPEREALEMLLGARGEDADYTIHLTYPVEEIDVERKADWDEARKREKKRREKNPNAKVRKTWKRAVNSLGALFEAHPKLADKVKFVDADEPHVIDLGDPLGF